MSTTLEQGLIILVFTSIVVLVILTVFAVRVLINAAKLTENLNKTADVLNTELEPTIKELNQVLTNVNKIANSADAQVTNVKKLLARVLGVAGVAIGGMKTLSGSFFKGFFSALKLFTKK